MTGIPNAEATTATRADAGTGSAPDAEGAHDAEAQATNGPLGLFPADTLVLAVPKGRILEEVGPFLEHAGIRPEPAFYDPDSRRLGFETDDPALGIVRVRSFDVATFVAFGAAHIGICGSDVLMEFNYADLYSPLDLRVGKCRLMVAQPATLQRKDDPGGWSHVRVATKYPELTRRHFAARGVQAETIKLSGAMELAPLLGLCPRIVDLVSTGRTLRENGLVEVEKIMDVSSRLIVNRTAFKTRPGAIRAWVERMRDAVAQY